MFLRNLLLFGRVLRGAGLDIAPDAMLEAARALTLVGVRGRNDVYHTLRTLLVHRRDDIPRFDEAFDLFFRQRRSGETAMDLRALGERRKFRPPERDVAGDEFQLGRSAPAGQTAGHEPAAGSRGTPTYSANETLRTKDFAAFTPDEVALARRTMRELRWDTGWRRTRRWRAASRGRVDLRRLLSRGVRFGGELVELSRTERVRAPRPLIVLCDISGSMERYSRMLLQFVQEMAAERPRVEIFLFATRLSRVTRAVAQGHADALIAALPRVAPDWAGGTRIGDALRTFHLVWARRVLRHGPVVLLISDGWDRGDPELLRREMARLQRSVFRLIWLNPRLGSPEYEPLTRGMQAALPFVDDFLPVHNLDSLAALARHLERLSPDGGRRPSRPHRPM